MYSQPTHSTPTSNYKRLLKKKPEYQASSCYTGSHANIRTATIKKQGLGGWGARNVRTNLTLKRVRISTVAVEKQYYIFWLSVCVCSLSYPAHNAHSPYYTVICGLFNLLNIKVCYLFSLQTLPETFLILRRIRRDIINKYLQVLHVQNIRFSCRILMKRHFPDRL
jgi:hypothetical protein